MFELFGSLFLCLSDKKQKIFFAQIGPVVSKKRLNSKKFIGDNNDDADPTKTYTR